MQVKDYIGKNMRYSLYIYQYIGMREEHEIQSIYIYQYIGMREEHVIQSIHLPVHRDEGRT